jgi:hypothetical protein
MITITETSPFFNLQSFKGEYNMIDEDYYRCRTGMDVHKKLTIVCLLNGRSQKKTLTFEIKIACNADKRK